MKPVPVASEFPASNATAPRFRVAGEVTLDLAHCDARVDDRWLGFRPQEFDLLWRLAEHPGARLFRKQLGNDSGGPEDKRDPDDLVATVARVREKLEPFGLSTILATHPDGGYYLDPPASEMRFLDE